MKSVVLMLLLLVVARSVRTSAETSDAYLRNVVEELQLINGVAPSERSTRVSYNDDDAQNEASGVDATSAAILANQHLQSQRQAISRTPNYLSEATQLQPPQPMVLGFTTSELAAMYRKAMERGVPLKVNNPTTAYAYENSKVVPALRVEQPGYGSSNYAYYFYPLHTFRHELEKPNPYSTTGYHTIPDSVYAATIPEDSSKKETGGSIMNPIIVGVSSFVGMALFFVFSMFIYPRILHAMQFPFATTSRNNLRNELGHLVAFVTDAIDAYNRNTRKKSKQLPQR